jgi:hypothetical protein
MRVRQIAAVLLLASVAACKPTSAEAVADKFVDLYFVVIDQRRALEFTTGLARAKIEEELSLVAEVRRTVDPDSAKPSVFYTRRSSQVSGERARFAYDITIRQGRDETHRNALISSERSDGRWAVANFIVQEGHLPAPPPRAAP